MKTLSRHLLLLALLLPATVVAQKRTAFLAGVDEYTTLKPLDNGVAAAERIGTTLERAGFEVKFSKNRNAVELRSDVDQFITSESRDSDIRIFYFSGHGLELNGANFLCPTDFEMGSTREAIARISCDLNDVMSKLETTQRGVDIVLLDCCRENPDLGQGAGLASYQRALTDNSAIIFAAAPGKLAYDTPFGGTRETKISPFTLALVEAFGHPHDSLFDIFPGIMERVKVLTMDRQKPWIRMSAGDLFTSVSLFAAGPSPVTGQTFSPAATAAPSPWLFPHSHSARLTHSELARLDSSELWRARNEIFARHGYAFKSERGLSYARTMGDAYIPLVDDVDDEQLTPEELFNIKLIQKYEAGGSIASDSRSLWVFPDSSNRRLSINEALDLDRATLWRARNEIFARNGLVFSTHRGKALCASLGPVYTPVSSSQSAIFNRLNSSEISNIELLQKLEIGAPLGSSTAVVGSVFLFPDSDQRQLSDAELSGLNRDQLWRARNEIFARRGYNFSSDKGKGLAQSLGAAYVPVGSNNSIEFNSYEQANIAKIRQYE